MKRWIGLVVMVMVMALTVPSMAEEFFPPPGDTLAIGFTTLAAAACTPVAGVYKIIAVRN